MKLLYVWDDFAVWVDYSLWTLRMWLKYSIAWPVRKWLYAKFRTKTWRDS